MTTGPDAPSAASSTALLAALTEALTAAVAVEPVTDPTTQRHLLRPVIADLVDQPPQSHPAGGGHHRPGRLQR